MKQSVIDQMKEYQHKPSTVRAIKYQEGMEDGWIIKYENYIAGSKEMTDINVPNKIFNSKDEANKYMASPTDETIRSDFIKYIGAFPVILREISKEEYEDYSSFAIVQNEQYFEYEELEEDAWIYITNNGCILSSYDSEDFFNDYELKGKSYAHIGYDRDLEDLYVEMDCIRLTIDKTEVATVEKLLEGFEIPFTERIGQAL